MPKKTTLDVIDEHVAISDKTLDTIKRNTTGRTIKYKTIFDDEAAVCVSSWFKCCNENDFKKHPAAKKLIDKINLNYLDLIVKFQITAFRGRWLGKEDTIESLRFGPPLLKNSNQNRYSKDDEPALYLSGSTDGVKAELYDIPENKVYLYSQKYQLTNASLKMADLSVECYNPIITQAFDRSELELDAEQYWKSQILAKMIKETGFDGMIVPRVRGKGGNRYKNIVLFCPKQGWKHNDDGSWIDEYELIDASPPLPLRNAHDN